MMSADLEPAADATDDELATPREKEIGEKRPRREDGPLLRGEAAYVDDLHAPDALHLAIVRSQYGHAEIEAIDTEAAEAMDGVVAVFTSEDLRMSDAPGVVGPIRSLPGVDDPSSPRRARTRLRNPPRPLLAADVVRYTGEPVVAVLAEDRYTAHDAADRVEVQYERLDAVVHPEAALEDDAPTLHEEAPENLAFDWEAGNEQDTDDAFEDADRTVSVEIAHQRVAPVSMEPRGALAEYDPTDESLTVHMGTQGPHAARALMHHALGLPEDRIRVVAPEVGGGFGAKSKFYPGEPLAAWCAIRTKRPVKWIATRSESFRSDLHGRGRTVRGELALDDDGTIRGLRVLSHANLGAYPSRVAPTTRTGSFVDVISGQYAIPAIHCRVLGCFTNTAPVDSYRGSSRPMSLLTVERLLDRAAADLGVDPAELRRRNFIPPKDFPYETPVGERYDSGEYAKALDLALDLAGYDDLRTRQADLREEGRYLGIGLCCVMDNAGTGAPESGRITVDADGTVTAAVGTADQGQGHRTAFAQLVADLLGVPFDDVEVREGDSSLVPSGGGASGSRSVVMGGEALRAATEAVVEDARDAAAADLEVDPADLEYDEGTFVVRGAPERAIDLQALARRVAEAADGDDERPAFDGSAERTPDATFPFGTHVAVVEVDPESGDIDLRTYVAVDDCGVPLNPTLVEGQIVGGVVQGLGQALLEDAVYDDTGTLVTGSLQDYAMPRAEGLPEFVTAHTVTPSPYNALGVKGAGESGATAAPAAVANAVADALAPFGVDHLDLPVTPEAVWRAVGDADC